MDYREALRQTSPLYYAATLFAPQDKRDALVTLYSFDFEIKRIPSLVSEPMLGQIRLQWWRDALNGERTGEAKLNPLAASLIDLMHRANMPMQGLLNIIDGEALVFDPEPRVDERELEKYFGLRFASLFQLVTGVLDPNATRQVADVCGHSGMAYGVARDLVSGRHAVKRGDLVQLGETHLQKARIAIKTLPDTVRPAFLPLVIVESILKSAKRFPDDAPIAMPSYLAILWRMLRFNI